MPPFSNEAIRDAAVQYVQDAIQDQTAAGPTRYSVEVEPSFGVTSEEIVDQIHEQIRKKVLQCGAASLRDMNYEYELMAVLDRLQEYESNEQIGAAYAGERSSELGATNGGDALTKVLFRHAYDEISSLDNGSMVGRFNEVTSDWPHILRAKLAAYEYARGREDDDYEDKLRDFAEAEGTIDMTFEQTELSHFYDNNPFADPSLSDDEAKAVMLCRMRDIDEEAIGDAEIEDFDGFLWWLKRADGVEEAMRAHHFGSDVPSVVVEYAAPPEEWEVLDPHSFPRKECVNCGDSLYQIETANYPGEPEWFSERISDGSIEGARVEYIADPAGKYYSPSANDGDMMCGECLTSLEQHVESSCAAIDSEGNVITFDNCRRNFIIQTSEGRIGSLESYTRNRVEEFATGTSPAGSGMISLNAPAHEARASASAQGDAIESIIGGDFPDMIDHGPLLVVSVGSVGEVLFPSDDIEVAHMAKELLDSAHEVMA